MKIHRFIDHNFNLTESTLTITDREVINQWKNVLRLEAGEQLVLGDGQGNEADAVLTKLTSDSAEASLEHYRQNKNEPTKQVTLYCAILKKENFELVVQKAVEVGVTTIVPITTNRTVKQNLRFDRLEKITKEAAEQSGRGVIPTVSPIIDFKTAIEQSAKTNTQTFLFDLSGTEKFPPTSLPSTINIFIGPEGGFTEKEVDLARQSGATISSLGALTLRGETAAIVASYLAVHGL